MIMSSIDRKRFIWVIISALLQGLLLGIYTVIKSGPLLCMPLTVICLVPFVFWLSQEHWGRRLFNLILGLTLILLAFWVYRLWSLYSPHGSIWVIPSQRSDLIRISVAVFLLIPFFQCRIASWSWKFPYSEIFFQLCRNLFLLFQASLVIAVFWGLLITAGLLFDIVGLSVVPVLLFNPITAGTLSSLIIAVSITVAIRHPGIDSLGRWILSVLSWLLPAFSIFSALFLLCLPVSGLSSLLSTGQASTLILFLQTGTLILINAAYLDGNHNPFNQKMNALACISILCLPVYSVLSLYSLSLRISQYGLTVDRVQAVFMAIIAGIWGVGYALCVVFRSWPKSIGRVNMLCALILFVLVVLMNTPLLDPFRLSAVNQLSRLTSGKIQPHDFDYAYMRFGLGRYGNDVLDELLASSSSDIHAGAQRAMSISPEEYLLYTEKGIPPIDERRRIIHEAAREILTPEQEEYFVSHWEYISGAVYFVMADVERGSHNIILLTDNRASVFTLKPEYVGEISGEFQPESIDIKTIEPKFMDVEISGNIYRVDSPK